MHHLLLTNNELTSFDWSWTSCSLICFAVPEFVEMINLSFNPTHAHPPPLFPHGPVDKCSQKYDLLLVSPRNYFLYTPLLPAVATGTMEERSIVEPVRNLMIGKVSLCLLLQ